MKKLILFILFIALLALPVGAWGATYYLSAGGSDTSPYDTWAKASTLIATINALGLANNDEVHLRPGDTFNDATLTLNGTSAAVSGIVIKGIDGDGKTIAGDGRPKIDGDDVRPIYIDHALVNLTIKDIDVGGQDWYATKSNSTYFNSVNGLTLDGIYGNGHDDYGGVNSGKNCLVIESCSGTIEIKNCVLQNWGENPINPGGTDYHAIHVSLHTSGTLNIHDNTIYDIQADAVQRKCSTATMNLYDNTFYNCGENCYDSKGSQNGNIYGNNFYREVGFTGNETYNYFIGIHVYNAGPCSCSGYNIYNNYLHYNHDGKAISISGAGDGSVNDIEIYSNWIEDCKIAFNVATDSSNVKIYCNIINGIYSSSGKFYQENNSGTGGAVVNNVFYCNTDMGIGIDLNYSNTHFRNNVIYMNDSDSLMLDRENSGSSTAMYNCWYNANAGDDNIIEWNSTTYTEAQQATWRTDGHTSALFGDPGFSDPASDEFWAASGSSIIVDSGNTQSSTYDNALDIVSTWTPSISVSVLNQNDYGSGWEIGAYVFDLFIIDAVPANNATGVAITIDPTWTNPAAATSVDVLFDKDTNPPTTKVVDDGDVETYDPGTLDYSSNYYWRVDVNHAGGTETGEDYEFTTTAQANPPTPAGSVMSYHKNGAAGKYNNSGVNIE